MSRRALAAITRDAGIDPDALSDFLEGTQALPSDSHDRLASRDGGIVDTCAVYAYTKAVD